MTEAGERHSDDEDGNQRVTVVGIGASAGGVQALQSLFQALPEDPGAAFVVVIHLDPDRPSAVDGLVFRKPATLHVRWG